MKWVVLVLTGNINGSLGRGCEDYLESKDVSFSKWQDVCGNVIRRVTLPSRVKASETIGPLTFFLLLIDLICLKYFPPIVGLQYFVLPVGE